MRLLRVTMMALVLSLAAMPLSPAVWAGALGDAKAAGLVGETPSGLLAVVRENPAPETLALIEDINAQRVERFREIAASTGATLQQVGALVGQRQIDNAPSGTFIQGNDGVWVRVP